MKRKSVFAIISILLIGVIVFILNQTWKSQNKQNVRLVIPANISKDSINLLIINKLGIELYPDFQWWANINNLKFNKKTVLVVKPGTNFWNLISLMKNYRSTSFDWVLRSSGTVQDAFVSVIYEYQMNTDNMAWKDKSTLTWFLNDTVYKKYNTNLANAAVLFIANTYNLSSKETPKMFLDRMYKESVMKFWNYERRKAIHDLNLTIDQAVTLASIVTKESNAIKEFGKIASVYKKRLKLGMLLQADPTVVYARGRAGRVLLSDTKINSPYNTYLNKGLPPGPLCIPDPIAIDSVLFGASYNYLYFCAKPDNSGTHNFAVSLSEHEKNASAYHRWLSNRN